jgi:hypothetical protein
MVAEVVQHFLPDMINIHNYITTGTFNKKKSNWEVFNRKVFGRLGLNLPEVIINDLCNAKPGTIEIVLFNLRAKMNEEPELRQQIQQQSISSSRQPLPSSNTVTPKKIDKPFLSKGISQTSRSVADINNKLVSRQEYEQLKQQCSQQQQQIEIIQGKMRRLEHLAQIKDNRITGLSATIEESQNTKPTAVVANKYKKK